MPPHLLYEKRGKIAYVTFNRPEALNAISLQMAREWEEAWEDFKRDDGVLVAILTGAGDKAFCAGLDLKEAAPARTTQRRLDFSPHRWGLDIYKPIIAAVNGYCIAGGMERLLGTDIRVAAEHAQFGLQEGRWSLTPTGGSHVRLPAQIPYCRAMEILLTGERFGAHEALAMGLINRVVPMADLMPTAERIAQKIGENGPLAVRKIKEAVLRCYGMPWAEAFTLESAIAGVVWESEDAKEGPTAFAEKRKPQFTGR